MGQVLLGISIAVLSNMNPLGECYHHFTVACPLYARQQTSRSFPCLDFCFLVLLNPYFGLCFFHFGLRVKAAVERYPAGRLDSSERPQK
ncbi:hypothetical protein Q5P01_026033 [Channa striata]|uniref:Uncharacterized protein n=1 Tax=Channa striata TaxID=64152 RepID=A0AA88LFS4_CHASR|nr:hypothetical protein Q5P01_026033 [Channa striata]